MIVAMITMRMVEMTFHQVVRVVTVRNRFVSAIWPMFVVLVMRSAIVVRGTRCWALPTHSDLVLVNMVTVRVVEVPIVKVILMAIVLHGHMSTIRTVYVRVRFVNLMIGAHFSSP